MYSHSAPFLCAFAIRVCHLLSMDWSSGFIIVFCRNSLSYCFCLIDYFYVLTFSLVVRSFSFLSYCFIRWMRMLWIAGRSCWFVALGYAPIVAFFRIRCRRFYCDDLLSLFHFWDLQLFMTVYLWASSTPLIYISRKWGVFSVASFLGSVSFTAESRRLKRGVIRRFHYTFFCWLRVCAINSGGVLNCLVQLATSMPIANGVSFWGLPVKFWGASSIFWFSSLKHVS